MFNIGCFHTDKSDQRGCKGGDVGGEGCDDGPAEEIENCNTEPCPDESPCEDSLFDVAFLIEANAIAGQSAKEIKQFLVDLIALYQPGIAPEHARMCLVRFSSWPETLASFNDIVDLPTALLAIDAIKFYGKGADLESGLSTVNEWCFDKENGWRGTELYDSGVASQLIIITASEAEFTGDIIPELKQKVGCLYFTLKV